MWEGTKLISITEELFGEKAGARKAYRAGRKSYRDYKLVLQASKKYEEALQGDSAEEVEKTFTHFVGLLSKELLALLDAVHDLDVVENDFLKTFTEVMSHCDPNNPAQQKIIADLKAGLQYANGVLKQQYQEAERVLSEGGVGKMNMVHNIGSFEHDTITFGRQILRGIGRLAKVGNQVVNETHSGIPPDKADKIEQLVRKYIEALDKEEKVMTQEIETLLILVHLSMEELTKLVEGMKAEERKGLQRSIADPLIENGEKAISDIRVRLRGILREEIYLENQTERLAA